MGSVSREIEDTLIGAGDWHEWHNNLKNQYENATEDYLESVHKVRNMGKNS